MDRKIIIIAIALIAIGIGGYLLTYDSATEYNFSDISFKSHDTAIVENYTGYEDQGLHTFAAEETVIMELNYNEMSYDERDTNQNGWVLVKDEILSHSDGTKVIDGRTIYIVQNHNTQKKNYVTALKKNNREFLIISNSSDETIFIAESIKTH